MNRLIFLLFLCLLSAASCAPYREPITPAELGYQTLSHKDLTSLPKPKGKIIVAVYNFRDQSGQYKFHPTSSSFSTAVTQGATAMLVQALRDSGWFIPVEREGLNNLLTERKIIRAKLNGEPEKELPQLLHAPVMIEGGIVSYETNVLTAGAGAEYDGYGGSGQFRKDQVGLYLRTVNVSTGEILQSVSTTKSIISTEVRAGVFRFLSVDKLLEIEAGFSTNEPPQMCVLEAIEKAVVSMVVEGLLNDQWGLANPGDMSHPVIQSYLLEKYGVTSLTGLAGVSRSAYEAFLRRDFDGVIAITSRGLVNHPSNVDLLATRAGAYANRGHLQLAIADADKALSVAPDSGIALNNKGWALELGGNPEEAILNYKRGCGYGFQTACVNLQRFEKSGNAK